MEPVSQFEYGSTKWKNRWSNASPPRVIPRLDIGVSRSERIPQGDAPAQTSPLAPVPSTLANGGCGAAMSSCPSEKLSSGRFLRAPVGLSLRLVALPTSRHQVGDFGDVPGGLSVIDYRAQMVPLRSLIAAIGASNIVGPDVEDPSRLQFLFLGRLDHRNDRADEGVGNARGAPRDGHSGRQLAVARSFRDAPRSAAANRKSLRLFQGASPDVGICTGLD